MPQQKDDIFAETVTPQPFKFDKSVVEVFPDMIERSVPGYGLILNNISKLANRYVTENSHCYDLGCSLGAVSLAISQGANKANAKVFGIDNSSDMINRCHQHIRAFKQKTPITLVESDILDVEIKNASFVVLNFTLQFVDKTQRESLLEKIYQGLNPNGVLILSEKIRYEDNNINQLMIDLHHQFKRENGYSELEISQKRNALENVLIPETLETHKARMRQVGFSQASCWFKEYNFASFIAIKS